MLVNLLTALRARSLRAYEIAQAAGLTESKLSRAISGRVQLGPAERTRIANFLDADESWLFQETVSIPGSKRKGALP